MEQYYSQIMDYLSDIPVIDTHEHLPLNEEQRNWDSDILIEYFTQYIKSDMISSGMNLDLLFKLQDKSIPIIQRWKMIEPYWINSQYTGYGRCLKETIQELYNESTFSEKNIELLNSMFLDSLKPGRFEEILKNRCHIKTALLNSGDPYHYFDYLDYNFFTPVYMLDWMIEPDGIPLFDHLYHNTGIRIINFNTWLDACTAELLNVVNEKDTNIFKIDVAYFRSLYFSEPDYGQAKKEFDLVFQRIHHLPTFSENDKNTFRLSICFQDFMTHYLLALLSECNAIVQIHTGLHEGNWNEVRNSDPILLTNLFHKFDQIKFDIFHMGYPFQNKLTALAKNYPNVYINMCWTHIVSPNSSTKSLCEFIDCVPINKILAFGGDYCTIEQIVGHLNIAKKNVGKALAEKVEDHLLDIQTAKNVAFKLFYENPSDLYHIK